MKRVDISENWQFRQETKLNDVAQEFLPVAQFPTVQWLDLLKHDLIPDPYVDTNEIETQWVNEADWTYKTEFSRPHAQQRKYTELVFDGLDTAVDVRLNGKSILFSKNMHVQHRVDVSKLLKDKNTLELFFESAAKFAKKEEERIGFKPAPTDKTMMGTHARLFLRKAQYYAGWDWGPCCTACGPWKPIYLEMYDSRIAELHVVGDVSEDLNRATFHIEGTIEGANVESVSIEVVSESGSHQLSTHKVHVAGKKFEGEAVISHPALWYPFTHGEQPLYTVRATLDGPSHSVSKRIGLRRLRLLQRSLKDAKGTSFTIQVNNVSIFCGGSDWIPDSFFLPSTTRGKLEKWFRLMKTGNQNMIRIWGGGIYESDDFYELCDEMGILIQQDFAFACGNYPAKGDFMDQVELELRQNLSRIRHHPSLVLLCGNNEDYMLAERNRLEYDINDKNPAHWAKTNFPAREIYERMMPELCKEMAPYLPYWESSPYGGPDTDDRTIGDVHIWDVWHGPMHPYQQYKAFTARFVSEFGFESPPDLRTIKHMLTRPADRQCQSLAFDAHDKGPGYKRRYTMYMGENFRFRMDPLEDYVYCAQLLQAEAIGFAYNCWRREFRGPGHELCSGVLVWQLNDNWPGTSWAMVDYFQRPKPVYYVVKRALQTFTVGMERIVTKKQPITIRSYPDEHKKVSIWATSRALKNEAFEIRYAAFDVTTGKPVGLPRSGGKVELAANQCTEVTSFEIPHDENTVVATYLESMDGKPVARWISWPEPVKYLHFSSNPGIRLHQGRNNVVVTCTAPVKGLILSVDPSDGEDAVWDDNCLDLVPDEEINIGVHGLDGRKICMRWLCDWESDVPPPRSNYLST